MSQHYSITRDLDDSDDDEEEGSEGTPKDGAVVLAALKPGMKMGNNIFGGQQGMHQDQPSFNQLQFRKPSTSQHYMAQYNHQNESGGQDYPNQITGPRYGTNQNYR